MLDFVIALIGLIGAYFIGLVRGAKAQATIDTCLRLDLSPEALKDRLMVLENQRADLLERCRQADMAKALPTLSTGEVRRALGIPLLGEASTTPRTEREGDER